MTGMKQLLLLNPEHASEEEVARYPVREAARAIVLDAENNVALLRVANKNYYKLPGGGCEGNESLEEALKRECREEVGCEIKITGEIGRVIEHRDMWKIKQESFYYLAEVFGEKGKSAFMPDEIEAGFSVKWLLPSEAIKLLESDKPSDYEGQFIVARELVFLREAEKLTTS